MSNTDTTPDTIKDSQGGESTAKPAGKQAPKALVKPAPGKPVLPTPGDGLPDAKMGDLSPARCRCTADAAPADASRIDRAIELYKTLIMAHPMQATHLQPSWIRASFLVVDEMQKFDSLNAVGTLKVNSPL